MTLRRAPTSGRGVAHGLAVAIGIPPGLAVPASERAVAAMMALKQAREAGGGMLRGRHLHRAQQHIAALDPARHGTLAQHLQAHALALQGRGGDTEIAHVTPGEVVVPRRLQHPEFLRGLEILAHAHGIDPATLRVGSGRNAINPRTGQMEFDEQDDIPLNMNGLLTGGYDAPGITLGNPSDYSTLNSFTAQMGSPNFDRLTPDFHSFDPAAYDRGNFNVNDLSNYGGANGDTSQFGSYAPGQGPLGLPQPNSGGPLAYPPTASGTGQSQYVDGNGNPIEGVTVTAPKAHTGEPFASLIGAQNPATDWNLPLGPIKPVKPPPPPPGWSPPGASPGGPDEAFEAKPGYGGKPAPAVPYLSPPDQRQPWIETLPHATLPNRGPYSDYYKDYLYGYIPTSPPWVGLLKKKPNT